MESKKYIESMNVYRDNIQNYFSDIIDFYDISYNSLAELLQGSRKTVTNLARRVNGDFHVGTLEALGEKLGATALDILQYSRERDYDRLINKSDLFSYQNDE